MKYILIPFIVFLLYSCSTGNVDQVSTNDSANTTATETQRVVLSNEQLASAGIETGHPVWENISSTIKLQGTIDVPPSHHVNLSFPLGGYIRSTSILPGKAVKKGEVLAIIEDMQFVQLQQEYLTSKTNLELATREFERQQVLNSSKASSDKVLQLAKAEMDRQNILKHALGQKLQLIGIDAGRLQPSTVSRSVPIRSPINGFVSKVNISIGKYTSPTDVLFELLDPADMHLALRVYENDLAKIEKGGKVTAFNNNNPAKRYGAKVLLVNPNFDENRSAEIHCHFDKPDAGLYPGMFMNAEVAVSNLRALVVPEDAIVRWANKYYVFVKERDGSFTMTEVKPGITYEGRQQIENSAISDSTTLVVRNAFSLLMKLKNTEEEG